MRSDNIAPLLAVLLLVGCLRSEVSVSVVERFPGDQDTPDFWSEVAVATVVTNDDALHGLYLLADGTDPFGSFPDRAREARERGWVGGEELAAREAAHYGAIAVAIYDILHLRGGVTLRIFGPSQRYCARELASQGIAPARSEQQSLSGLEFIDLMRRCQELGGP